MKVKILLVMLVVSFVLTSCTYSQTGIEGLLQPPKLSQQQNEIYSVSDANLDKNTKLKYPRKGDYKSAFVINNIDDEPTQEALVFYEKINNTAQSIPLRINVLDQENGKWVSKNEVGVENAIDVEKVSFIISNHKTYVVIGFNHINKYEKIVKFYVYEEGVLKDLHTLICTNYEVFDINGDGKSEIVTVETKDRDLDVKTATGNIYQVTSDGIHKKSQTPMDPNVSDYVNIYKGKISNGNQALYFDCLRTTNSLSTEILTVNNGKLTNLIYNNVEQSNQVKNTIRPYGAFCLDLNQDGIYEVPNLIPALGYEKAEPHQQRHFTQWFNYKEDKLELIKTTYIDYQLGYLFILPEKWMDKVTIETIINEDEVIFYEYNAQNKNLNKKLVSIKVMKKNKYLSEMNQKNKGGIKKIEDDYQIIKENGQLVYLYKIYKTGSDIRLNNAEVENSFALIP